MISTLQHNEHMVLQELVVLYNSRKNIYPLIKVSSNFLQTLINCCKKEQCQKLHGKNWSRIELIFNQIMSLTAE